MYLRNILTRCVLISLNPKNVELCIKTMKTMAPTVPGLQDMVVLPPSMRRGGHWHPTRSRHFWSTQGADAFGPNLLHSGCITFGKSQRLVFWGHCRAIVVVVGEDLVVEVVAAAKGSEDVDRNVVLWISLSFCSRKQAC